MKLEVYCASIGLIVACGSKEPDFFDELSPDSSKLLFTPTFSRLVQQKVADVFSVFYTWKLFCSIFRHLQNLSDVIKCKLLLLLGILVKLKKKWALYSTVMKLKRVAKSRRHFFYLLEKKTLKLPIDPAEDEIDSYLDCKRSIGKGWPFMWVVSKVKERKVLCDDCLCVPMSSYSYLDFLHHPEVQQAALDAAQTWATGNHGPRMLGGNMQILVDLEQAIAKFFNRDSTLICAAGYLSSMSAIAAVSTSSTVLFVDSRIHASIQAGLKVGEGKYYFYRHNDFESCEKLVQKHRKRFLNAWIVVESVYSMDGTICDLPAANRLCEKYKMLMIIDEAHGLGVLGATGRGVEEHFGMPGCATLIVGTFSKSAASIGGYITGPKRYIDYFDFHAPGNVFSAPLPAYCAGAALKSFELMDQHPEFVQKLQSNAKRLRHLLCTGADQWPEDYPSEYKYVVGGDPATSVIPIIFKNDIDRVLRIATRVKQYGYMCSAVAFPACPLRTPRFRITATAAYTEDLMTQFVQSFVRACVEEMPAVVSDLMTS